MERPLTDPAYPYPSQPAAEPAGPPRTSGLAIWSLVLGLLGILPCCLGLPSLVGVILGIAALASIAGSAGRLTGRGLAWTGVIAGLVGIVFVVVGSVVLLPKAMRFYPGMGQSMNASEGFLRALSDKDLDRAYKEAGAAYRKETTRAEFDARVGKLLEGRGTPQTWQPVDVDQVGWLSASSGDTLSTTITFGVDWSEGGSSKLVLVWEWPWTKEIGPLPKPSLKSFEIE